MVAATPPPTLVRHLQHDEQQLRVATGARFVHIARDRQRIVRALGMQPALAARVIALRRVERDDLTARRDLVRLGAASPAQIGGVSTGPALPLTTLVRAYRAARRRFGIRWQLLAAINFVESDFGRARTTRRADAQGPMQFEPATWRRYGMGGDVNDPHDAIMAAANLLAANGGRTDERRALGHYNLAPLYWDAVLRLAHRITVNRTALREYYAWRLYLRPGGKSTP